MCAPSFHSSVRHRLVRSCLHTTSWTTSILIGCPCRSHPWTETQSHLHPLHPLSRWPLMRSGSGNPWQQMDRKLTCDSTESCSLVLVSRTSTDYFTVWWLKMSSIEFASTRSLFAKTFRIIACHETKSALYSTFSAKIWLVPLFITDCRNGDILANLC